MSKNDITTDICIIGGGLVGLTTALKLAHNGLDILLCAPEHKHKDARTTAFLMHTVQFFQNIDIWKDLTPKAFPLKTMRIVDGTNRLIRAPQTNFRASEIDLEAFGYNLRNQDVLDVLNSAINKIPNITRIDAKVENVSSLEGKEVVTIKSSKVIKTIEAGFVVGADGKNSIVRQDKKITAREWEYPQTAIVVDFKHKRSTQYTSTEFHTKSGPFTIVPHDNHRAGLVWMETPQTVEKLLQLSEQEFALKIEQKMQSYLGKIELISKPQSFPIKGLVANKFGEDNHAIVGEAAHVFPPIGAQGFNLGIRDIEALSEVLLRFTNQENRGEQYDRARKLDINSRTYGVDLLNRSLISDFLPMQIVRGIGLHLLGSITPLRKYAMKMGISPNT